MVFVALILLAGLALLPMRSAWSAGLASRVCVLGAFCLYLAGIVAATMLGRTPSGPIDDRPIEVHAKGYVGSKSCRSCHPSEHASWHGSFHRTMTQVVSREALQVQFDRLELDW